jgi:potassium/chloride transporter 9
MSGIVVLMGEFATSFFSALMGVIGSAKLLQALARDKLIPGLSIFGQGTKGNDEPTYAIIVTYVVAQLTMLADINQIASFVTMTYLMTFLVTNLACFLLTVGSAPNFRPSFHFFNWQTAFFGTVVSGMVMFFVDSLYAAVSVGFMAFIFLLIHYTTPPKSWGDVSQSLIYHQVRKYLLRLRSDHIKFWRPSVLLLINDPRRQYKLIQFCNSLKKGGLFILGHAIITQDFAGSVAEAKRQQNSWQKYIDFSKIKAFVNIAISPAVEWGARNIVLGAGLGGMRPNIVVMGFFNLNDLRKTHPLADIPSPQPSRPSSMRRGVEPEILSPTKKRKAQREVDRLKGRLPTDLNRPEGAISAQSYMTVLEDLLLRLQINVAIGKGFQELEIPAPRPSRTDRLLAWMGIKEMEEEENVKKYIDLWPIQMSAEIAAEGDDKRSVLTSNFDTYTLILQLGCILDTVPSWKRAFQLRVCVFVEYESDVEEERSRVTSLLNNLRIQAEVLVFWLASGSLPTYEIIVNGRRDNELGQALSDVNEALEEEEWWQDVQKLRSKKGKMSAVQELAEVESILGAAANWPSSSFQHGRQSEFNAVKFEGLRKIMRKAKRRASVSSRGQFSGPMKAQSSALSPSLIEYARAYDSASESSSSSSEDNAFDDESDELAASENDMDEYLSDQSPPVETLRRSRSVGNNLRPSLARPRKDIPAPKLVRSSTPPVRTLEVSSLMQPEAGASDTAVVENERPISNRETLAGEGSSRTDQLRRPPVMRHQSLPKFSSKPVPATQIASEEGDENGRSIMFAEQSSTPPHRTSQSIYAHHSPSRGPSKAQDIASPSSNSSRSRTPASGFPSQQAVPLTFNDLPSRAQHLILNDLLVGQSAETAVLLTTLPSPVEGTCESDLDSVRYLSDLEVLCQNLPPVLLVHSNSMTVTMNL